MTISAPELRRIAHAQWKRGARAQVVLDLPFPPSLNHYWRTTIVRGHVATYISDAGKLYRRMVIQCAMEQDAMHRMRGSLCVTLDAYPPDARTRDLDNVPKGVLDALTHAHVWLDDSQVDELVVRRMPVVRNGRLVVTIDAMLPP